MKENLIQINGGITISVGASCKNVMYIGILPYVDMKCKIISNSRMIQRLFVMKL